MSYQQLKEMRHFVLLNVCSVNVNWIHFLLNVSFYIFFVQPAESITSNQSNTSIVKNARAEGDGGLFGEDDKTSSFKSENIVDTPVVPVAAKPKRKTNQISLFDNQDDEEDADDLFASIAPSKGMR